MTNLAMRIRQRSVEPGDTDLLFRIYAGTREDEIEAWGWSETQKQAFLRMQFDAQRRSFESQYPRAEHNIVLLDGNAIGRLMVCRSDDAITIVDIALLPEGRGQGIGTVLIRSLLEESMALDKPVRLHVLKGNPAANLYARLGFVVTAADDFYVAMEWRRAGA